MKRHKFSQQVMAAILGGLLLVGCATSTAIEPTNEPAVEPTMEPIVEPTQEPTAEPTREPTVEPTHEPTVEPTESAPVGVTVELLDQGKGWVEMHEAPHPNSAVIAQLLVDMECIVVSGPITAEDITFWKLDCLEETSVAELHWLGWIDVTMLEVNN